MTEDFVKKVNDEGYSKEYGARNIRRKAQELLENGLAEFLLKQKLSKKRKDLLKIIASVKGDKIVFTSD